MVHSMLSTVFPARMPYLRALLLLDAICCHFDGSILGQKRLEVFMNDRYGWGERTTRLYIAILDHAGIIIVDRPTMNNWTKRIKVPDDTANQLRERSGLEPIHAA